MYPRGLCGTFYDEKRFDVPTPYTQYIRVTRKMFVCPLKTVFRYDKPSQRGDAIVINWDRLKTVNYSRTIIYNKSKRLKYVFVELDYLADRSRLKLFD